MVTLYFVTFATVFVVSTKLSIINCGILDLISVLRHLIDDYIWTDHLPVFDVIMTRPCSIDKYPNRMLNQTLGLFELKVY